MDKPINYRGYSDLVLRNIRRQYGDKIAKYSDQHVMDVFADWNMSDKSEDLTEWMDSVSAYNDEEKAKGDS